MYWTLYLALPVCTEHCLGAKKSIYLHCMIEMTEKKLPLHMWRKHMLKTFIEILITYLMKICFALYWIAEHKLSALKEWKTKALALLLWLQALMSTARVIVLQKCIWKYNRNMFDLKYQYDENNYLKTILPISLSALMSTSRVTELQRCIWKYKDKAEHTLTKDCVNLDINAVHSHPPGSLTVKVRLRLTWKC